MESRVGRKSQALDPASLSAQNQRNARCCVEQRHYRLNVVLEVMHELSYSSAALAARPASTSA